jgi:alpha-ketoglutarate-dependent taurine dioxygenase
MKVFLKNDKHPIDLPARDDRTSNILKTAKSKLEKEGYWVFNAGNAPRALLLKIADGLGKRQSHAKSDPDGIREVTGQPSSQKSGSLKQQYTANTTEEFKPHTDGTFLDGIAKAKEGSLISVSPPKIVLMQMVQPAAGGGRSTVLDGRELLEEALEADPQMLETLLQPYFIHCRDDQWAKSPVFARVSPQTWKIRWRYDFATLVEPRASEALNLFYRKYVSNPKYIKYLALEAGDILVTDNWRILHGREAYTDDPEKPRLLRRLWVGDDQQVFVNPLGRS